MSDGIRGSGPPRPPLSRAAASTSEAATRLPSELSDAKTVSKAEPLPPEGSHAKDVFEAGGAPRTQLRQELGAIASQRALADLHFSDQELAKLAGQLLQIFRKNPKASSRAARAKLATKTILRGAGNGRLGKLLGRLSESESERMEEDIASMIAESPRLGEWLDSISEEAHRGS